jgi:hypothetical protein
VATGKGGKGKVGRVGGTFWQRSGGSGLVMFVLLNTDMLQVGVLGSISMQQFES